MYFTCKSLLQIRSAFTTLKAFSTKPSLFAQTVNRLKSKSSDPLKGFFITNISRFLASSPHENITSIQVKKRPLRKKKTELSSPGVFNVVAFATSEEYNLESLVEGLQQQDLYEPQTIPNTNDVVHGVSLL